MMSEINHFYRLTFQTPDGMVQIPVCHRVTDENDGSMGVTISANIQGRAVSFDAETTEEALRKLTRSLPQGWRLNSCLSCRHGHFCPVGDYDNELFCVTDFEPREARDLWDITENEEERNRRRRTFFDLCEKYAPQTKDDYTYS